MKEHAGNVIVPNYSESSVDVIGDASEVKQLYETKFDFNKIIPMPEPLHIDGNGDETKCANCKEWTNLKCDCAKGSHLYRILSSDYERMVKNDLLVRSGMALLRDIEDGR